MRDPREGRTRSGSIVTGVAPERIPSVFGPVVRSVVEEIGAVDSDASVYLFGSVANGQAEAGRSDVDVLAIGPGSGDAGQISAMLSDRFAAVARSVDVGCAHPVDFVGPGDEAYGNRVFLRHYCIHLGGPVGPRPRHDFLADRAAARGFNGDIALHRDRWRAELERLDEHGDVAGMARRLARKTLLAVAGLVSVHDETWTTDRATAAIRWPEIVPDRSGGLAVLLSWADDVAEPSTTDVATVLDRDVDPIVDRFGADIGLWSD